MKTTIMAALGLILASAMPWASDPWVESPAPSSESRVLTFFSGGSILFATTQDGRFYRSNDQGQTWAEAPTGGFFSGAEVKALVAHGNALFAGTSRGVYRSTDLGLNWTPANNGLTYSSGSSTATRPILDLVTTGRTLFVAAAGLSNPFNLSNTVFRSTDDGQTWIEAGTGLPTNVESITKLAVSLSVILAATSSSVYRSLDEGRTWVTTSHPGRAMILESGGFDVFSAISPGDFISPGYIYRSSDQGQTWEQVYSFLPGPLGGRIEAVTASGVNLFVTAVRIASPTATLPVFLFSSDRGQNWTECGQQCSPPPLFGPFLTSDFSRPHVLDGRVFISRRDNKVFVGAGFFTPAAETVSAASFIRSSVAGESIVASFGLNLATTSQTAASVPLPTMLEGSTVKVRDSAGTERLAPLFFVSPGQINHQIPQGTANGVATVTITANNADVGAGVILVEPTAPGLFAANMNGEGVAAAVVVRVGSDGSQAYEPAFRPDSAQGGFVSVPIDLGPEGDQVFLILFGTGFRRRGDSNGASVQIDGIDAQVTYAGPQGDFVGLDQVNIRLPRVLRGRGKVAVSLTVDSITANILSIDIR